MNIIVSVTENMAIGKNGQLIRRISEDMKFFRRMTTGGVVIMGKATLESLPGGRALKDRVNIVMTSDKEFSRDNVIPVNDIHSALKTAGEYDTDKVFVIGGESIYRQLLPYCKYAYLTKLGFSADADKFFPDIDSMDNWSVVCESEEKFDGDISFKFVKYENSDLKRG